MGNFYNILHNVKAIYRKYNFRYWETLKVNFSLLPLSQAIHLPIVIYNKTQLTLSRSRIHLQTKARFGLLVWGRNDDLMIANNSPSLFMMINGDLYLNGFVRFSSGYAIRISGGKLYIGKESVFGGGGKLLCNNEIHIGEDTWFAFDCIICDTNFHYIEHDGQIADCDGKVIVGSSCWIGNNTTIMRGAILPQNAIVSAKSYVNKDLSSFTDYPLIAGIPAKVKASGYKRVFDKEQEKQLKKKFSSMRQVQ